MLNVNELLLSGESRFPCRDQALGERIRAVGKDHLWEERKDELIDVVVIHYISASEIDPAQPFKKESILRIFCDFGVSSHYLIERHGDIIRLVPERKKAWHCGGSIMPEPDLRTGVNEFSIGIELAATDRSGFTSSQYHSLCDLCNDIEVRYGKKFVYVGHDQIAGKRAVELGLRSENKVDPGPLFDWSFFHSNMDELRSARRVYLP